MSGTVVPPRYARERDPCARTYGPKVARLAAAMGLPLMPWQQQVADTALELDDRGVFRYSTIVLTVPRQSGKTSLLRPVLAHRALMRPKAELWLTAQMRQDARDTWADTASVIEASPLGELTRRRDTNGSECLSFSNGSRLRLFNAGSDKALHGKQSDLVFIDEAFAFTAEQGAVILQAVVPTQATRPGAQTWIVSTAGTASSTWLREFVLAGRAQDRRRMAYFEWSIPEDAEDLADLDLYARHHPALGHTIGREALETAFETMAPSEFARAYGNFWTSSDEWVIAPAIWQAAATVEEIDRRKPLALAVEVSADRASGALAICGTGTESGTAVLEIVDQRGGIGWITPRVLELLDRYPNMTLVIDPVSPAGTVHRELTELKKRRRRIPLLDFGAAELVDGHTEFMDGLTARTVRHSGDDRLDTAVAAAAPRTLRETTVFSRRVAEDGTSPAALLAAVLALYGHRHALVHEAPRIHVVTA